MSHTTDENMSERFSLRTVNKGHIQSKNRYQHFAFTMVETRTHNMYFSVYFDI